MASPKKRIAFVVSHPIQYYAPLYQRLAQRDDVTIKVFFTWHSADKPVTDSGFGVPVAWDIPLTSGYTFELVPNTARNPGTHHFFGLRNPTLIDRVMEWGPDIVHITGWAWLSHLSAMRAFARRKVPTLFRGDSHLLNEKTSGPRWWLKRMLLKWFYSWPTAFLVVGSANRAYYEAFGVEPKRLLPCPHSIDVARFAEPGAELERMASEWRQQLGIPEGRCVLVYAGKFERKKRPLELARTVRNLRNSNLVLVMVGDGELEDEIRVLVAADKERVFMLPFQNQTKMPLVYRLGHLFILPSAYNETWGLAVNEAMACGRAVLVSDRAGCSQDIVDNEVGRVFSWAEPPSLGRAISDLVQDRARLDGMGRHASRRAWSFDIRCTEEILMQAVRQFSTQ